VPPEFSDAPEYVEFVVSEVLPEAAGLADAADVFLEQGSFEVPEARRYIEACADNGLALRLHADQFSERGAIPLAIELGARSAGHLEATGEEGARSLGRSDVAGVLLPACGLFLDLPLPPLGRSSRRGPSSPSPRISTRAAPSSSRCPSS
jgi:imidazolonepropionase